MSDIIKSVTSTIQEKASDIGTATVNVGIKAADNVSKTVTVVSDVAQAVGTGLVKHTENCDTSEIHKESFKQVMLFYLVLIIILGIIGYMNQFGIKSSDKMIGAIFGMIVGCILSKLLWILMGSNYVKNN
jgi:uncharacterized membrane protein required for colicin V production